MEQKICPLLLLGNYANAGQFVKSTEKKADEELKPKCLRKNCALWVDATPPGIKNGKKAIGHCGLIHAKYEHVDYLVVQILICYLKYLICYLK